MKSAWNKWKKIAEKIGNFQFKIIFSLFYLILITPLGLITKNKDFLKTKPTPKWQKFNHNQKTIKDAQQQ